jgi:hypothetical protein
VAVSLHLSEHCCVFSFVGPNARKHGNRWSTGGASCGHAVALGQEGKFLCLAPSVGSRPKCLLGLVASCFLSVNREVFFKLAEILSNREWLTYVFGHMV